MASLIVTSGNQRGEYLPLGSRTNVIGRTESLPRQILDDMVSRKHLRVRFDESTCKYSAEGLESRHGLFINGKKVTEPVALKTGDQILLGQTILLFTDKDFDSAESALAHYKKVGERQNPTCLE